MDGAEALSLPLAASRRERIAQIFGKEFADALRECKDDRGGFRVRLFLGNPLRRSNSRKNQFIFVNGRPVRDQIITSAVYRACEDVMPKDSHPVFFAFLDADPASVDVNVHPTKREVRFADRQAIFSLILGTARKALAPADSAPETPFLHDDVPVCPSEARFVSDGSPVTSEAGYPSAGPERQGVMLGDGQAAATYRAGDGDTPFFYIGDTFVALPGKDGLTLMDYHAAHERVNYEKFLKKTAISAHRLLFPQQVKLTAADYRIIIENAGFLSEFGLDVDDFGHETVVVRSLPDVLRDADAEALLGDLASSLLSREDFADPADPDPGLDPSWSIKRKIAARLACHGSYRGKEDRIRVRIGELLRDLDAAEHPHVCPHGRPTRIFLSLRELKKMFRK